MAELITPPNGTTLLTTTATFDDATVIAGSLLDLESPAAITISGATNNSGTIKVNGVAQLSVLGTTYNNGPLIEVEGGAQLSLLGATTGNGELLVSGPGRLNLLGGYTYSDNLPGEHLVMMGDGGIVEVGSGDAFVALVPLDLGYTHAGQPFAYGYATHAEVIVDSVASTINLIGFQGSDTIGFAHPAVSVSYTATNTATSFGTRDTAFVITQAGYLTITESDGSVAKVALNDYIYGPIYGSIFGQQIAPIYNTSAFSIVNGLVVYSYTPLVAPVISGTAAGQATRVGTNERPFGRVVVTDSNAGTFDFAVVQLGTLNGTLRDPNAATDGSSYDATKGTYTIAGSAAQVTQALNALVFVPNAYTLGQGGSFTTKITLAVGSSVGLSTADGKTSVITYAPLIQSNFAGNGDSGLLVQNNNGATVIDTANGLAVTAATSVGNPGPSWHLVGSADFNGDGQSDLLYQNDNGALVGFLMSGTAIASGSNFGSPGSDWHVRGTGDFNADGFADVLVQDGSGHLVALETNGAGVVNGVAIGSALPQGAAVEAVADFNGDGRPDLLVQTSTGELDILILNGTTVVSTTDVGNPGSGDTVLGAADYNADGTADIVLRAPNGDSMAWTVNGGSVTGAISLGNLGTGPGAAVTGADLNGDGHADLVVQNSTTGTVVGFLLDGTGSITAGAVLSTPGAGWNIVGSNPISFIDGTGGNLNLVATPGPDQFNLTAYQAGVHTISGFNPSQDTLALAAGAFPTYAVVQANEAAYQGGTFINLTPTAAIVIQGVTPSQLGSSNFVLR